MAMLLAGLCVGLVSKEVDVAGDVPAPAPATA
jgi:hypothetical protein